MIEHDIMRRVREWMAGGPPPHGLPFSSANLQTRGAQPRTALTKPPFSWIDHLIRPLQERRRDREAEGLGGLEVDDQLGCSRARSGIKSGMWWLGGRPGRGSSHEFVDQRQ